MNMVNIYLIERDFVSLFSVEACCSMLRNLNHHAFFWISKYKEFHDDNFTKFFKRADPHYCNTGSLGLRTDQVKL